MTLRCDTKQVEPEPEQAPEPQSSAPAGVQLDPFVYQAWQDASGATTVWDGFRWLASPSRPDLASAAPSAAPVPQALIPTQLPAAPEPEQPPAAATLPLPEAQEPQDPQLLSQLLGYSSPGAPSTSQGSYRTPAASLTQSHTGSLRAASPSTSHQGPLFTQAAPSPAPDPAPAPASAPAPAAAPHSPPPVVLISGYGSASPSPQRLPRPRNPLLDPTAVPAGLAALTPSDQPEVSQQPQPGPALRPQSAGTGLFSLAPWTQHVQPPAASRKPTLVQAAKQAESAEATMAARSAQNPAQQPPMQGVVSPAANSLAADVAAFLAVSAPPQPGMGRPPTPPGTVALEPPAGNENSFCELEDGAQDEGEAEAPQLNTDPVCCECDDGGVCPRWSAAAGAKHHLGPLPCHAYSSATGVRGPGV